MFVVGSPGATEWTERSEITFNKQSVCKFLYLTNVSIPKTADLNFAVAGDKHPIFDQDEGFNMQYTKMLSPIRNKTISASVSANRSESQNSKASITSVASNQRVPFGEIKQYLPYEPCSRSRYTEIPFKFMRTNDDKMIPNNSAIAQKENLNYFGQYASVTSFEKC